MDKCIINPKWIYIIEFISKIEFTLSALLILALVALVIASIVYFMWWFDVILTNNYNKTEDDLKNNIKFKSFLRKGLVTVIILLVTSSVLPNRHTLYSMWVASYTTPENVEFAGELITDTMDYIFDNVDRLLEDNE